MFVVVEVKDDEFGQEYARVDNIEDAELAAETAYIEEGMVTEILKLVNLKDVYGVETDRKAWVPVDVLKTLELEV